MSEIQNVLLRRLASKPTIKQFAKLAREAQSQLRTAKSELEFALDPTIRQKAAHLEIVEAANAGEIMRGQGMGASVHTPAHDEDAKLRARVLLNRLAVPYAKTVVGLLTEAANLVGEMVSEINADEARLFSKWQCPRGHTELSRGAQLLFERLQQAAKDISNPGPAVQHPYTANYESWIVLIAGDAPTGNGTA